jgi:hypothetical protein
MAASKSAPQADPLAAEKTDETVSEPLVVAIKFERSSKRRGVKDQIFEAGSEWDSSDPDTEKYRNWPSGPLVVPASEYVAGSSQPGDEDQEEEGGTA